MVKNRNFIFGGVTSSSQTADKYFMLPKIATGDLPPASQFEGCVAYDSTQNIPVFSNGTSWVALGYNVGSYSPSYSASLSPSISASKSPSISPSYSSSISPSYSSSISPSLSPS
jgi:hypothetical protein